MTLTAQHGRSLKSFTKRPLSHPVSYAAVKSRKTTPVFEVPMKPYNAFIMESKKMLKGVETRCDFGEL